MTANGAALYFATDLADAGGKGGFDIFVASPPSSGTFANVSALNTSSSEYGLWLSPSDSEAYFSSNRTGAEGLDDIYASTAASSSFGAPSPVANLNSAAADNTLTITADGKTIYFGSTRSGADQIWVATRTDTTVSFSVPTAVTELATAEDAAPTWISPDGCNLYFQSAHAYPGAKGGTDIYVATKPK